MIRTFKINIPTIQEIIDLKYPLRAYLCNRYYQVDTWAFKTYGTGFWKLMYKLTGRCGSILYGHAPIFNNPKRWLWISSPMGYVCSICHELVEVKESKGSYKNFARQSREEDVKQLLGMRERAEHESERLSIDKALYNINHEERRVKDMREDLIKATREHEHDKIQEIHEFVGEKKKYRREVV